MYYLHKCIMCKIILCTGSSLNRMSALGADGGGVVLPS